MKKEKPLRVYGSDIKLKMIREYAKKNNLSASNFLFRLAMSEISKHPKNAPLEEIIEIKVKEGIEKYFEEQSNGVLILHKTTEDVE